MSAERPAHRSHRQNGHKDQEPTLAAGTPHPGPSRYTHGGSAPQREASPRRPQHHGHRQQSAVSGAVTPALRTKGRLAKSSSRVGGPRLSAQSQDRAEKGRKPLSPESLLPRNPTWPRRELPTRGWSPQLQADTLVRQQTRARNKPRVPSWFHGSEPAATGMAGPESDTGHALTRCQDRRTRRRHAHPQDQWMVGGDTALRVSGWGRGTPTLRVS